MYKITIEMKEKNTNVSERVKRRERRVETVRYVEKDQEERREAN